MSDMPDPLDVKFQDHYAILGVDQQSVSETIQRAYAKLAQKYNSRNADTGNAATFEALNLAYEVLSHPARRREFDKLQGIRQEGGSPKLSGVEFFDALGREFLVLPLSYEVAAEAALLANLRDPADRAIVATARAHRLRLITSDQRIIESKLAPVVA